MPLNTGITQKDLINVVAQAELAVAVVTPAVDLSVLQRGHRVGLAAGDAHNLAAPKGRAHFPFKNRYNRITKTFDKLFYYMPWC